MSYRFLDHTADVAVELEAESLDALFADGLAAFTDTLTERDRVAAREERRFSLGAPSLDGLLVDWLEELLFVFETEGVLFREAQVAVRETGDDAGDGHGDRWTLSATARGEPQDPQRHPARVLVKGVTYHGLEVREEPPGRWQARLIFDI